MGVSTLRASALPRSEIQGAPYRQQLVLDWTDYCNAKCFFCYREKYEQQIGGKGEFIRFAKLKKLERVLQALIPDRLLELYEGRLWVRADWSEAVAESVPSRISFVSAEISEGDAKAAVRELEQVVAAKDEAITKYKLELARIKRQLHSVFNARSCRVTGPPRAPRTSINH